MECGLMSEGKPFTANGFTSGSNGRLGVPELRTPAGADLQSVPNQAPAAPRCRAIASRGKMKKNYWII